MPRSSQNTKNLARKLGAFLIDRDVRAGRRLLEHYFVPGAVLDPADAESYNLLLILAQWVDLGFRDIDFFESQLAPFEAVSASRLTVSQYLPYKLAESYRLLARIEHAQAIGLLQSLIYLHRDLLTPAQNFVAHFWLGRALRQAGSFGHAYDEIKAARRQAESMGADKLQAVTKIHESWLVFHRGDKRSAFELLDEAEQTLIPIGHSLSLANIAAARGRFIRSTGDYQRALGFFEQAIRIYTDDYPNHPNLARSLVNAAYVKRLIALDLQSTYNEKATAAVHARKLNVAAEAMELLRAAGQIYARHQHQGGTGSVLINLGHLKLESGEIESASEESEAAFALSQQKSDKALMARACILRSYIQMARSEEQLDDLSTPLSSAHKALRFAEDAVTLAESTQNHRLLAGAYITHGLALTAQTEVDWELARHRAGQASELLRNQDRDHLFRELRRLHSRIAQPATVEGTLRRWMSGELGEKSFQEVEEEFAQIVIPRVWVKLGRNISRVAQRLNVSPKKVRRALLNAHGSEAKKSVR
jgi:tetratricopeptide (TPR) repeat protein